MVERHTGITLVPALVAVFVFYSDLFVYLFVTSNQTTPSSSSPKIFKGDKNESKNELNEENVQRVLGATDFEGRLLFLIEMMDKTKRIIEAQEAYDLYPKTVLKFFESLIVWE